ncbi:MAG: alpha-amylase family glycosyl hydrolase [Saprospiraceae bacterium]
MKRITLSLLVCAMLWGGCQPPNSTDQKSAQGAAGARQAPAWAAGAILYQVNVRQFSPEGNFAGLEAQLPRISEMGFNVIWLMPIHPIGVKNRKGALGSPYSVRDFEAINPEFGTEEDFRKLVRAAHNLGLKVILDWVPNHSAWDCVWMSDHPEYYTRYNGELTTPLNERGEPITDWADVCDLDYGNAGLRQAMIDAMLYWVREFDIDGYRVDQAGLVPTDFWSACCAALGAVKPLLMIAEWEDEPEHFRTCFQANYAWRWKDVTRDIAARKQRAVALDTLKAFNDGRFPKGYWQLLFTQNHDENAWHGTEAETYGEASDAFTLLAFTLPGLPMAYNGQEDRLAQRLAFFDRDPIRWKDYARAPFFKNLCALRAQNTALRADGLFEKLKTNQDEHLYAFARREGGDKVIVIVNLSPEQRDATCIIPPPLQGAYNDLFAASSVQIRAKERLQLKPWGYLVLYAQ